MKYKVLSIAGFDGSGGAGLQADLKTFSALGCYGMTALTALPVQNTTGVKSYYEIPLKAIQEQLEAIFEDILPDSIKIGMLFKAEIVELVAEFLLKNASKIPIVLDPVMVAKSGHLLLLPDAINILKTKLIPLTTIITPNIPEASKLIDLDITTHNVQSAAESLLLLGSKAVLLKGGHLKEKSSNDFYIDEVRKEIISAPRITTKNTHGTGCTLSAAIASYLAFGIDILEACKLAKHYLHEALIAAQNEHIGLGSGPVHHFYKFWT